MKKMFLFVVFLVFLFVVSACSQTPTEKAAQNETEVTEETENKDSEKGESSAQQSEEQTKDGKKEEPDRKEPLDISYLNTSPMTAFEEAWGQYDLLDSLEYEVMVDQEVVFEDGWPTEAPDPLYQLKWQREQEVMKAQTDWINNMEYRKHTKLDFTNELEESQYNMEASRNGIPGIVFHAALLRDYYDEMVYVDTNSYKEFPKGAISSIQEKAKDGYISLDMEDDFFYALDYYQILLDTYFEFQEYIEEDQYQWIEPDDNNSFKKIKLSLISETSVVEDETLSSMGFGLSFEGIELDNSSTSTIAYEAFHLILTIDEAGMPIKEEWELTMSSYNEDNIKELTYKQYYDMNNLSFNQPHSIMEKLQEKEIFSYYDLIS